MEPEKRLAALRVIGALAGDLREDYSMAVDQRIELMYELAAEFGIELPPLSEQDIKTVWYDGRFFRDEWVRDRGGPYGCCSSADLALIGENFGIFLRPRDAVIDYVPLKREDWGCDR
jgi:hypothetical protein